MNTQNLFAALAASISPNADERHRAELALESFSTQTGYVSSLLKVVVEPSAPLTVQQSAAIQLKNTVGTYYNPTQDSLKSNPYIITEQEKAFIRQHFLETLVKCHHLHRGVLCAVLHTIIAADYPARWPSLVDEIVQLMQSTSDQNRTYASLLVLCELLKTYKYAMEEEYKVPLFDIVRRTFPLLTQLFTYLVTQNTQEFAVMRKLITKIFWYSFQLDTPDYFMKDPKNVEVWMDLFQKVYTLPVPVCHVEPNPYWGAKKWILHIIYRIFINSNILEIIKEENKKKFAKHFMERYSLPFLALCLNSILDKNRGTLDMPPRIQSLCYYYVGAAIRTKEIYRNVLKPKVETIIKDVIFPQLFFTNEDRETWQQDSQEYLRMNFAFLQDIYSPKIAAGNALQDLLDTRKEDAMPIFMNYFNITFQQFLAETNIDRKRQMLPALDGLLYAFGNMKKPIMADKTIRANMEKIMANYILPMFSVPEAYLRARACWIAGLFALIKWENKENLLNVVKAILNGLQDKNTVVKVQAGMALTGYLENKTITSEILPILPKLLEVYVNMMQEMDNGDVVVSIDYLVDAFRDQMEPFALDLCHKMAARFLSIFEEPEEDFGSFNDQEEEDYGEGVLVCANALRVIRTLLGAVGEKNQAMLRNLQELLVPILVKVFVDPNQKGFEYFEELCEIASCLTYFHQGPLNTQLIWQLYPAIISAFNEYASFYVHYIVPPLDNFISKGTDVFLSDPKYVEMILQVINFYWREDEPVEKEAQAAAMLTSVMLQSCKGKLDSIIPQLLQMIMKQLITCETTAYKILLLNCICDSLLYNMNGTLQVMESNNFTMKAFGMWLETIPKMSRIYDNKLTVLALTTLLSHPDLNQLPKAIQNNIGLIIITNIRLLIKIKQQRIQQQEQRIQDEKDREIIHARIMNGEHFDIEEEEEGYSDDEDYGEEEDDVDVTGIMKTKPIQKLLKDISENSWDRQADDDELDEEDETYSTAIDNIDENVVFGKAMVDFSRKYNQIFMQIVEKLSQEEQTALRQMMN